MARGALAKAQQRGDRGCACAVQEIIGLRYFLGGRKVP
jgi:hypothetical protein